MEDDELQELSRNVDRKRKYASNFHWPADAALGELGVVQCLIDSMTHAGQATFHSCRSRPRGEDPPDCEAIGNSGERVAIEVTEIVEPSMVALHAQNKAHEYAVAIWTKEQFLHALNIALEKKHDRHSRLKGGPYPGGYIIVIFTAEPALSREVIANALHDWTPPRLPKVTEAYLVLSYDPAVKSYPYFPLKRVSD